MFYLSGRLAIFILVIGPAIGWIVRSLSERFRRYSTRIQTSMGDVTRVTEEAIEGHRVIKVFNGQDIGSPGFVPGLTEPVAPPTKPAATQLDDKDDNTIDV